MCIFKDTKTILINCGLGTDQLVQVAGKRIPRSLIRLSVFSFPLIVCVIEIILCINGYADGFAQMLYSFSILLTYSSGVLIYATLTAKSNKIIELFNYLADVVQKSDPTIFKFFFLQNVSPETVSIIPAS